MEIVGISGRDSVGSMAEFVARHDLGHTQHAADIDEVAWRINEVPAQPAWVFIDGATGVSETIFGELTAAELAAELDALLAR